MPLDFSQLPILSSPLANGKGGGRSFDFVPTNLDVGINDNTRQLGTASDHDGRSVEIFERLAKPAQWYLRWTLDNGVLYTHLREEDGVEMCAVTAGALSILEDDETGLPFLVPFPPLKMGNMAWPGYQESARWRAPSRPGWMIILRRPGFIEEGRVVQAGEPGQPFLRAGTPFGIEVQLAANDIAQGRAILESVLTSLAS